MSESVRNFKYTKYERICPTASRILEKRTRTNRIRLFFINVFSYFMKLYVSISRSKNDHKNVLYYRNLHACAKYLISTTKYALTLVSCLLPYTLLLVNRPNWLD